MEMEGKKVIVPWEEYQDLLKDREALNVAREELRKDCKERGLYVELNYTRQRYPDFFNPSDTDEEFWEPLLNILSQEGVLKEAQKEVENAFKEAQEMTRCAFLEAKRMVEEKEAEIKRLRERSLWDRILNKEKCPKRNTQLRRPWK